MGACLSCLSPSQEPGLNENTPLLSDDPHVTQPASNASATEIDKLKREQELSQIVDFTGRNLIDLISVQQPEPQSSMRSASEYKAIIQRNSQAKLKDSWPKLKKSTDSGDFSWLKDLAKKGDDAIKAEPVIEASEPLIVSFG